MQGLSPDGRARAVRAPIGWLATIRPDGSPHVTPVWFVLHEETFWIATARGNRKIRNLLADPRASIAVDGTATEGPLVAEGAVTVRGLDVPPVIDAFRRKYDGWDATDSSVDGERVLLALEVRRWLLSA